MREVHPFCYSHFGKVQIKWSIGASRSYEETIGPSGVYTEVEDRLWFIMDEVLSSVVPELRRGIRKK